MAALTSPAVASGLALPQICGERTGCSSRRGVEVNRGSCLTTLDRADLQVAHRPDSGYSGSFGCGRLSTVSRAADQTWPFFISQVSFASLRSSSSDVFACALKVRGLHRCRYLSEKARNGARAFAMEVAEEAFVPSEGPVDHLNLPVFEDRSPMPALFPPKNKADDPSLHNPLLRLERMGCGWLGVILEWDGVIVEDDTDIERKAWTALAEEEGIRPPPAFILRRAEGMKNEQAISEVLCWSRDPRQMRRLAQRKDDLFQEMQGGIYRLRPGSWEFVHTLKKYKIPIALVSTRPRKILETAIEAIGMEGFFNVVVAAEDVHRGKPDPEMFLYAVQSLGFIPDRCIIFGNSNSSVEAAHDAFMKCIAVAGKHPIFELGAADLVVRKLDDLSVVDLKNLADLESPDLQPPERAYEPELEEEEERFPQTQVALYDRW